MDNINLNELAASSRELEELQLIRKMIQAYINTTLTNEEKLKYLDMFNADTPKTDIS